MKKTVFVLVVILTVVFGSKLATQIRSKKLYEHRIVGGSKAANEQFPYQVSVQKKATKNNYEHVCGGSIIAPRYVLSAAHCVVSDSLRVRVGILHLDDSITLGQTVLVQRAFVHPAYDDDHGDIAANDIAVLRLRKKLVYSTSIQAVNLPKVNESFSGVATLSGWGKTSGTNKDYSNYLMFAEMHLITLDECKENFTDAIGSYGPLDDSNICTQDDDKFGCQGDSGGPLVQNGTIIGVVSFATRPCDIIGVPTAYCDVSKFVNWINDQELVN